jgi:hypothetical protein
MKTILIIDHKDYINNGYLKFIYPELVELFLTDRENLNKYFNFNEKDVILIGTRDRELSSLLLKKSYDKGLNIKLVNGIDFDEKMLHPKFVKSLSLYALELLKKDSIRSKTNFILKNNVDDFNDLRNDDDSFFQSIEKESSFLVTILRISTGFNDKSMEYFFSQLEFLDLKQNKYLNSILLNTIRQTKRIALMLVQYCKLNIFNCEKDNYLKTCLMMMKFLYNNAQIDAREINNFVTYLVLLVAKLDTDGEFIDFIKSIIESDKNHKKIHEYVLIMYSESFNNHKYINTFHKSISEPTTNLEHKYFNCVKRVKDVLSSKNYDSQQHSPDTIAAGISSFMTGLINKNDENELIKNKFHDLLAD